MGTDVSKLMKREHKKRKTRESNQQFSSASKYEKVTNKKGDIIDVILKFGKEWNGWLVTEVLRDPQGQSYITGFILNPKYEFPKEMKDDILLVMEKEGFEIEEEVDIDW